MLGLRLHPGQWPALRPSLTSRAPSLDSLYFPKLGSVLPSLNRFLFLLTPTSSSLSFSLRLCISEIAIATPPSQDCQARHRWGYPSRVLLLIIGTVAIVGARALPFPPPPPGLSCCPRALHPPPLSPLACALNRQGPQGQASFCGSFLSPIFHLRRRLGPQPHPASNEARLGCRAPGRNYLGCLGCRASAC